MSRSNEPGDPEYKVGKGKPPVHSQFQKGRSGNPSGRPKRAKPPTMSAFERACATKVPIREHGKVRIVRADEAILKSIVHGALRGDKSDRRDYIRLHSANVRSVKLPQQTQWEPQPIIFQAVFPEGRENE